ncbi:hypothetical protein J1N35_000369 [Gossypium stocksii]|uniref:DUF4283 domain-containing protein n=1 Tax=Gossypium stocksii TaxID=47602 RepID=A0A9D3WI78_9ROSI|nr:hypothetical protein J1N35_000369 [Gossypium stocksii]
MEEELANLSLLDDEEESFQGESPVVDRSYQYCLVGRCLTESVVHFPSLRNTMADLWHLIGGICISDLGDKRYLFQFFHKVDVNRFLVGTPWFFNNHLLILQRIPNGEDPDAIVLNSVEFWIQVHELPLGLMTETMAREFDDFCGKFIDYDTSMPSLGHKNYMRIRVCLDVSAPLKCKKKIQIGKSIIVYARFKYEKLSLFCFICGTVRHGKSYCPYHLRIDPSKIVYGWHLSLRAITRRQNVTVNKWLREADGSKCIVGNLESHNQSFLPNEEKDIKRNLRGDFGNQQLNPNLIPLI